MVIETGWPNDYQNYMILSQGSGSFTRAFHAHASPAPPARRRHVFRLVGPVCGVARRDASGVACAFVCRRRERADAEDIRFHEGCLHSHRLLSDSCFCCFVCFCFLWACLVPITPPPPCPSLGYFLAAGLVVSPPWRTSRRTFLLVTPVSRNSKDLRSAHSGGAVFGTPA